MKPKTPKSVTLQDLVGGHTLSGVDRDTEEIKTWGDQFEIAQCIRFVLGGKTYVAVEDPNDGYRSTMREIRLSEKPCLKTFPPVKVVGQMKGGGDYGQTNNTLQLIHAKTKAVILEVGTDNSDDYYPWYVATFNEENL